MDLLKYDHHAPTNEFLDSLCPHMFLPNVTQPARVTSNSKTLINNILSNILGRDSVSRNLAATVSDRLPQFVVAFNSFSNSPSGSKPNIYERDSTNFDQENFILDYLAEDWGSVIKKEQVCESFLSKINFFLAKYGQLKKVFKHKLKFKSKPWITSDIQKSISVKSKLLSIFIKLKDADLKSEAHFNSKQYRKLLSTLLKRSKQSYFKNNFQASINASKMLGKISKRYYL